MILRKKTSRAIYAQCLIDTAANTLTDAVLPQTALGIIGFIK